MALNDILVLGTDSGASTSEQHHHHYHDRADKEEVQFRVYSTRLYVCKVIIHT